MQSAGGMKSIHRSAQRLTLPANGLSFFAALGGDEACRCWFKGFVDCNSSLAKLETHILLWEQCSALYADGCSLFPLNKSPDAHCPNRWFWADVSLQCMRKITRSLTVGELAKK